MQSVLLFLTYVFYLYTDYEYLSLDLLVLAVPGLHLLHLTDQVVDLGLHGL